MAQVGVLALQGDFAAHANALREAGADTVREVRVVGDLADLDGLVLPGGESTAMLKLLQAGKMWEALAEFASERALFGTCAGTILMARHVRPQQQSLGVIDVDVERNGYGRQLDSRVVSLKYEGTGLEAVFIRAPLLSAPGPQVEVLIRYLDRPVAVEQGRHLAVAFHPELSSDRRLHRRFLSKLG